jgi:opacity protein-like surface antigen
MPVPPPKEIAMKRLLPLAALLLIGLAPAAFAQVVELTPSIRYVTGDDIDLGSSALVPGDLHIQQNVGWGVSLGFASNPNMTFEGQFGYQGSRLDFKPVAGNTVTIFDMTQYRIMGNFLFSKPGMSEETQPYFLLGLGSLIFDPANDLYDSIGKFSWQIGLGVKHQFKSSMGIRLQALYMPTYLTSEPYGYWCDPYYGCYSSSDYHYLNQFDFSLGLTKRFGTYR